jgi:putative spermidine/putrescine transport system permease protein
VAVAQARPSASTRRRLSAALYPRRGLKLALLVLPPLGWLTIAYLGALAVLFVAAFWRLDPLSSKVLHTYSLDNFRTLAESDVYRAVTLRTVRFAAITTLVDAVLAFPFAYYMTRIASARARSLLFVACVVPLWSSYLVKVYTWKLMVASNGAINWTLEKAGAGGVALANSQTAILITFCYIWLPFMILPIYAALERIPDSLLEASSDLGARARTTFWRVILPLALPGVAAGSIFTFSLTLGDYIVPQVIASKVQVIGNVIYTNVGIANNLPFGAAFAAVPAVVIVLYLVLMKRLGAFEAL